ncbi:MAG: hypothetical protein EXS10_10875 [Phycisphaerales bacterium]|nr:hypothetical protein [Phycisphaerales bacterium]
MIAVVGLSLTACSTNTNYFDLMRATADAEQRILIAENEFEVGPTWRERNPAKKLILELRQKQWVMAGRIRVTSMPEVLDKSMTKEQGNAKKAELVAAAKAKYEAAKNLSRPSVDIMPQK